MTKDRLLELVRKEEVVLFVGAGMSLYAGYPSGATLATILYEGLPLELKKKIEKINDLPKLADDIYQIMGANKNYLLSTLKKEFQKQPSSIETHEILAKIPQFKSIITTNYDTLIESTNSEIEVVRNSKDYSIVDKSKQCLFKIHGDFTNIDSIILTASDYRDYFSTSVEQQVFWTAVKDRLASNHIVFVGYSLEDSNVITIIDKITRELGDNKKEMFFISPSLSASKEAYLRNKSIAYIQLTGEDFIMEVFDDLKQNYLPELTKGSRTASTVLNFASKNGIKLNISQEHKNIVIESFKSILPNVKANTELRIELPEKEAKLLDDALKGKLLDNLELDGKYVTYVSHFVGDVRVLVEDKIKKIEMVKQPGFEGEIDLILDDGTEELDLDIKLYASRPKEKEFSYKLEIQDFIFLCHERADKTCNLTIQPKQEISNTLSAMKILGLVQKISNNVGFKVYRGNSLVFMSTYIFDANNLEPILFYEYLKMLKRIESHYKVRFKDIKLSDTNEIVVRNILAYIDKKWVEYLDDDYPVRLPNSLKTQIINNEKFKNKDLVLNYPEVITLNLHNLDFPVGKPNVLVYDFYIVNQKDFVNGDPDEIKIWSKKGGVFLLFSDQSLVDQSING